MMGKLIQIVVRLSFNRINIDDGKVDPNCGQAKF
jgi:hypothetical protein